MKSYWLTAAGAVEFREIPVPVPAAGEVVIRTRTSSLNRGELLARGTAKPGGMDAAGVVHAIGEGCAGFQIGDEVCGRVTGGWAEFSLARTDQLMVKPAALGWEQAAAIGVAFITAHELTGARYGNLAAGETLLIAGVSSGVGVAALQIAKARGARVIGTSGSAEKLERLAELGLDHRIQTRSPDFAARVLDLTKGRGADLAINLVGGSVFGELVRALARKGRLGIVGYMDGVMEASLDLAAVHANRLEIFGVSNSRVPAEERADSMRGFILDIWPMLDDGRLVPMVDRVFPLDQVVDAKAWMEVDAQLGKVVLSI